MGRTAVRTHNEVKKGYNKAYKITKACNDRLSFDTMAPFLDHKSHLKKLEIINYGGFRWRAINALKAIVLEANGFIFGGFVRDSIRHDKAATAYYKRLGEEHNYEYIVENYENTSCDIETLDRLIVPRDIDVMFYNKSALELLKIKINDSEDFRVASCIEADGYMPTPLANCSHHKMVVTCKMSRLLHSYLSREPAFEIDVIILEDSFSIEGLDLHNRLPPFGDSDFECNKLVLFQTHGQEVITMDNPNKVSALQHNDAVQKIIKDIVAKKAIFTHSQACEYRIKKMMDKGFKIETQNVMLVASPTVAHNVCTICHDEIEGLHVKRKCCSAAYHGKCLDNVMDRCTTCPQCRATFDTRQKSRDRLLSQGVQLIATDTLTFGAQRNTDEDDEDSDGDADDFDEVNTVSSSSNDSINGQLILN